MTDFDVPNNNSSMKFALKSVPGLADVWVPHGVEDGPRTLVPRFKGGGNSNRNNWSRKTKKALHSYQTDEQQCSMHMVTHHHLAGRTEHIRVLRGPMRSYPNFFSEL